MIKKNSYKINVVNKLKKWDVVLFTPRGIKHVVVRAKGETFTILPVKVYNKRWKNYLHHLWLKIRYAF